MGDLKFSLFDVFVAFGILQGLFCSILLLAFKRASLSKQILALVLLVFILLSFKIELHTLGLWQTNFFRYFPLAIDLAIQPLIYLYALSLTQNQAKFDTKHFYHFIPAGVFIVHAVIVYFSVYAVTSLPAKDLLAEKLHFNQVKSIEDYLSIVSSIAYWYLGYRAVTSYRLLIFNQTADAATPSLSWLRNLLILMGALIIALTVNILSDSIFQFGSNHFFHWQTFYIFLSILIYYLGFAGYYQPDFAIINVPLQISGKATLFNHEDVEKAKKAIAYELETNKVYLEQDINLTWLAAKTSLSPTLISATINQEFGKNFRNLVNGYRVELVKTNLADPDLQHLSILGIALESGFNSEASFYRAFKKHTGISPTEYLHLTTKNTPATKLRTI